MTFSSEFWRMNFRKCWISSFRTGRLVSLGLGTVKRGCLNNMGKTALLQSFETREMALRFATAELVSSGVGSSWRPEADSGGESNHAKMLERSSFGRDWIDLEAAG